MRAEGVGGAAVVGVPLLLLTVPLVWPTAVTTLLVLRSTCFLASSTATGETSKKKKKQGARSSRQHQERRSRRRRRTRPQPASTASKRARAAREEITVGIQVKYKHIENLVPLYVIMDRERRGDTPQELATMYYSYLPTSQPLEDIIQRKHATITSAPLVINHFGFEICPPALSS